MQCVCDVVISELNVGVSQKSGKPYYTIKGVIVGCPELPLLASVGFNKFISEDVYNELAQMTHDRFDLVIGVSTAPVSGRECDLGFKLFINGLPREESEEVGNVPQSPASPDDKNKNKGGK